MRVREGVGGEKANEERETGVNVGEQREEKKRHT